MAYTTIDDPSEYFNTILYTGNGSTQSITNSANAGNFQPDWVWFKRRNGSNSHQLYDAVRGATKRIRSDTNEAESTVSAGLTSFDSNGFSLGSDEAVNVNSGSLVAWQWKAGGTAPTKTYKVVVVSDSGNKYRFRNSGDTATYAASAVTLDLQEGGTYIFDQSDSSNSSHPLRFYTASDKSGGEYTTGVTTSGTAGNAGAFTQITVAASAPTLYYQCSSHAGMGGQVNTNSTHGQTNFDGANLSVVQANTTAGFSIITYEGNYSSTSIGHGLNSAPDWLIFKNRDSTDPWALWHVGLNFPTDDLIYFNTNAANQHDPSFLNTAPSSSVITLGAYENTNQNNNDLVCYAFHSVKGYSKFGSYTGNGSSSDGPFVYTGFKPAWIMIKRTDSTNHWGITDNKRDPDNLTNEILLANSSGTGYSGTSIGYDILSNGFKIRNSDSIDNTSGGTYIYMCFASSPFVSSKGVPITAR